METQRSFDEEQQRESAAAFPLVSVIMPAFNAAGTIVSALNSVATQTWRHLEVIVVNDGSTDETSTLVQRFARADPRVQIVSQQNKGVAAARNLGLSMARGEFIATLDADDLWHPTKLQKQVNVLARAGSSVGLVYTYSAVVDEAGRLIVARPVYPFRGNVFAALVMHNFIGNTSSALFRRTCLGTVGGFDESLRARDAQGCEDLQFYLSIAQQALFEVVPEFLTGYRATPGAMSSQADRMARSWTLVMSAARRRHPELPRTIVRWSEGNFYRWLAFSCLRRGEIKRGSMFFAKALIRDPLGTPWGDMAEMALKRAGINRQSRHSVEQAPTTRQAFLDIDPAELKSRSFTSRERRRISYASSVRLSFSQPRMQQL